MEANYKIKESNVYSIFGRKYGKELITFLRGCCDGIPSYTNICNSIRACLGISNNGDPLLVLNQKGEWVSAGGGSSYTFQDTNSVTLTESAGVITADVKIDPNPLNTLSVTPNGLLSLPTSSGSVTEEFLDLNSGNTVTLPATPIAISVYRNGMRLSSSEYTLSGSVVTFVDSFGLSGGASGSEDVIIDATY